MMPFITLEGPEGCGKSTQARLLATRLEAAGVTVVLTREPGGDPIAEQIRGLILAADSQAMVPLAELFLFLAARAQHVATVIRPALARGAVVVCDRFTDATVAYQGYGRGLPLAELAHLNALATDGLQPQLTFLVDLPVEVGLARKRSGEWTRLEASAQDFHERVRAGYHALAAAAPDRVVTLDGQRPIDDLAAAIWRTTASRLPQLAATGADSR